MRQLREEHRVGLDCLVDRDGAAAADPRRSPHCRVVRSRRSAVVVVAAAALDRHLPSALLVRSPRSPGSRGDRHRLGVIGCSSTRWSCPTPLPTGLRTSSSAGSRMPAQSGIEAVSLEVDRADDVLREVLVGHGFAIEEDGLVETWLAADARPRISRAPRGLSAVEPARHDAATASHDQPRTEPPRSRAAASPDLAVPSRPRPGGPRQPRRRRRVRACSGTTPQTATGLVEPMRTEDDHQRRGLARHILTTGIDLLAAGRRRAHQDLLRTGQPGIE